MRRVLLAVVLLLITACASTGEPTTAVPPPPTVVSPTAMPANKPAAPHATKKIAPATVVAALDNFGFVEKRDDKCFDNCHLFVNEGNKVLAIVTNDGLYKIAPVFLDENPADPAEQARLVKAFTRSAFSVEVDEWVSDHTRAAWSGTPQYGVSDGFQVSVELQKRDDGTMLVISLQGTVSG